ncbi:hypothetical protein NSS71_25325 [Niallia sp. FSL W8-0951]|uniref:hypothetical protein n=1 Tax=Niallia sp. FSL W8-0951 TaxID=2954639 RepID=UPI0030FA86E3
MGLLKRNVQLENGLIAQTVYYKISSFIGNKDNVTYNVNAYASKESADVGFPVLFTRSHSFQYTSSDLITSGYVHLKEIDEFKDAEIVLEEV